MNKINWLMVVTYSAFLSLLLAQVACAIYAHYRSDLEAVRMFLFGAFLVFLMFFAGKWSN